MEAHVICLSGGGARGPLEVAAVEEIVKSQGITPVGYAGVSVGALNAAILAHANSKETLLQYIETLKVIYGSIKKPSQVAKKRQPGKALGVLGETGDLFSLLANNSAYDISPLKKIIERYVSSYLLRTSGVQLRVGVVDLHMGMYASFNGFHPRIKDMILASASIPLVFKPQDKFLVDGGVIHVVPISDAIGILKDVYSKANGKVERMKVHVICSSPILPEQMKHDVFQPLSSLQIFDRFIDLMVMKSIRDDLRQAIAINRLVTLGDLGGKIAVDIDVYAPSEDVIGTLDFYPAAFQRAFAAGTEMVKAGPLLSIKAGERITGDLPF